MPNDPETQEARRTPSARLLSMFHGLTGLMNGIGTVWIFALVFLVCADVLGRALFNHPLAGVPELVALSIVGIVYLELANTLRVRRFIRSDVIIGRLLENRPRLGHALQAVHHLVGAMIAAIVLWFTAPRFLGAWESDEYIGTLGDFTAPVWPVKLIIVVGTAALSVQFLLHAWTDVMVATGHQHAEQEDAAP